MISQKHFTKKISNETEFLVFPLKNYVNSTKYGKSHFSTLLVLFDFKQNMYIECAEHSEEITI